MRRVLSLAVLLIFSVSNTFYSQVVIKEKVGIKPKFNSVSKSLAQHIIRVDLQWEPIDVPAAIIDYSDTHYFPCRSTGGTDWETGGNLSYQIIDAAGGNYNIQFRFGPPCNGQEEYARYSIYYDNDSVTAGTFTIAGCFSLGGFPHYNLVYKSPLITDYNFQIYPKNLCIGEEGSLYYELGAGCTNIEIDTSVDKIDLQIVTGEEYVSFFRNGQSQGDNLTVPFSETDDIDIIQDQFYSGSEIIVKIKSSVGDLIKYDSLLIYPKNRYRITASENSYPMLYDENFYMEVHIAGPGGCLAKLPPGITLNAQIVEGNDLGYLHDLDNGITGDTLNNIPLQSGGVNHIEFISSGELKSYMDTAFIRLSISDEEINDVYVPVVFTPGPLVIDIEPPALSPGETAVIRLEKRLLDGNIVAFDSSQTFEIGITDGCVLGSIVADNDTGAYFYGVPQPLKFVADTANGNSGEVKLRIAPVFEIIIMNTKNNKDNKGVLNGKNKSDSGKSPGNNYDKTTSFCFGGNFKMNDASNANIKISSDTNTILLGETKYYQAKYDSLFNRLVIEEIKPGGDGIPKLNGGLASDVWGNNPVSIDTGKNYGKRMGVYWETEKPVWVGNTNKGNLEKGLIRLIGRYWSNDSTYIVILKAKRNNRDSVALKIDVVRPSKLLSKGQTTSYSKTRNVRDSVINIDSLSIFYGGLNGIPPQFIKGHICQESDKIDFGGKVGIGFAPSYRYEPYTTQTWKGVLKDMKTNPFYITATTNVNPPDHKYVKTIPYFKGDTITVWQIVAEHSQLLQDGSIDETRLYGIRTHVDTMNFKPYTTIQNKYHMFFKKLKNIKIKDQNGNERYMTLTEKADSTNKRMIKYLRDEFTDGVGIKGMKNMIAQTRIASSYGYFQPLYTTAVNKKDNWKYQEDAEHLPENLNENSVVFPLAVRMQKEYLEDGLKHQSLNNWQSGFEAALKKYILKNWNSDDKYPSSVMDNTNRFLPQK